MATTTPAARPKPAALRACPLCLDDLHASADGATVTYSCHSCGAVSITVRGRVEEHDRAGVEPLVLLQAMS